MIPAKQLFPGHPALRVTQSDRKRLEPHMAYLGKLNELLVMDTVGATDLRRMIWIEVNKPAPRPTIIRKLLGRVATRERQRVLDAIANPRAGR